MEAFRNLPFDDRVRFPDLRDTINSRSTLALIRVSRHYLPVHPRLQRASLIQVDSYGISLRAENEFETRFLRLDFEKRVDSETGVELRVREMLAPGYDRRRRAAAGMGDL